MSNLCRDLTVLIKMKTYCEKIKVTLKRFNNDYNTFLKDDDFKDSVSMKIFQIGELVNHLSSEYLEETKNEMNWNAIRGMRNHVAHGYDIMDSKTIFNTAKEDIPILEDFIDKDIKRLSVLENSKDNKESEEAE